MAEVLVRSELNANVWKLEVAPGESVAADQDLLILESMKTEIPVAAPCAGRVREIRVGENESVVERQILVVLDC